MKNYRPLLLENLGLALPGLEVRRLRLHEHLPRAEPHSHAHGHAQVLIYLRGQGAQMVGGHRFVAKAGSIVYVAPREPHEFRRERQRRPLCLVLDLKVSEPLLEAKHVQLPAAELSVVRRRVSDLLAMRASPDRHLAVGAAILDILAAVRRAGRPPGQRSARNQGITRRAERLLSEALRSNKDEPLSDIAARLGFQRDHLNRLLKAECGLTLGQLRAQLRLKLAQRRLSEGRQVGEVASSIGIDDQNYFARWFRAQTGVTPSRWAHG